MGRVSLCYRPVANDSQRWLEAAPMLNQVWAAPCIVTVAAFFVVKLIGFASATVTIVLLLFMVPLNLAISKGLLAVRKRRMTVMDARLGLCNEMLVGTRVIKYFAWEKPYLDRRSNISPGEIVVSGS